MDREQLKSGLRSYTRSDAQLDDVMSMIDQYVDTLLNDDTELWTAGQGAEYLGLGSADAARATFSRKGIRARSFRTIPGQRGTFSLYPADLIRALKEKA